MPPPIDDRPEPLPIDSDGSDIITSTPEKTVFTTGEVAKICKVSQQTIIRCFDNGLLGGFKVPGGSRHRRIPREKLVRFMQDNGIPMEYLTGGVPAAEESTDEVSE